MNRIKKLTSSKMRLALLGADMIAVLLIFMLYLLISSSFQYYENLAVILTETVLCAVFMVLCNAYNEIDTGLVSTMCCIIAVSLSTVATIIIFSVIFRNSPRVYYPIAIPGLITMIAFYLIRTCFIYYIYEYNRVIAKSIKSAAMVVGAGSGADLLLRELDGRRSPYFAVCVVDDSLRKVGTKINNVPVLGTIDDIPGLVKKNGIETIIIAIPSATNIQMSRILDICAKTKCVIKTLPSLSDILKGKEEALPKIRNINMEDLLGRDPVTVDTCKVHELVHGKVCMVTGGGGSIGSELCRQIISYMPSKLIIVDIYENNAYSIQQELRMSYGKSVPLYVQIASVRDYDKLEVLFDRFRPQLVFHAAAHKHVPLMEYSAEEAIKNNVFGTYNMASLAIKYRVDRFLLISTDKAVNPTNVMGASKRCCEKVIKYFSNMESDTVFVTVRFGNVLGSNGSAIPLFERQIENGGPVTITHPDITRYFMTIPEAVSLVLQANTMAQSGQIFVLDMGEPVRIVTLAENLIRMYGYEPYKDIKIEFIGLREGEKLYEELRLDEEQILPTYNKKIFIGNHINIPDDFPEQLERLRKFAQSNDSDRVVEQLKIIVPNFTPDEAVDRMTHHVTEVK